MIKLGQMVQDVITGFEGVVVARYDYLHGCSRLSVQPVGLKDGKPLDELVFDEQRLKVLDEGWNILDVAPQTNAPGGDRSAPFRPLSPPR